MLEMRYILIHGLGQSSSSWDKTISCMGEKFHAGCPDVPQLLSDKEPTYNNLYHVFSEYCLESTEPVCLCGEKDKANKKAARELANHIPEAEFCTVKGAGHEVNVDVPEKLASIINAFWNGKQNR